MTNRVTWKRNNSERFLLSKVNCEESRFALKIRCLHAWGKYGVTSY